MTDPSDVPIFAAAIVAEPKPKSRSPTTFDAFHTDRAKRFFAEHGLRWKASMGFSAFSVEGERGGLSLGCF